MTHPPAPPGAAGRFLPWAVWGLGALFYCYGFFQRVAPSVMVEDLMRDFAASAAITGTLSALYFYAYASLQLPIGILLDRWGARRILAVSGALAAIGGLAFAAAPGLGAAYAGRALVGVGAGVTWVGALTLAAAWFPARRFALLAGLTMASGTLGAVGGQVPLALLVGAFGWRPTMLGAAGFAALLAAAMWLVVRDRPAIPPEGQHAAAATPAPDGAGFLSGLKVVLREPQTYWTALYGAMQVAPALAFAGLWGVPYLMTAYGLDRAEAAASTSAMLVGWGIGSPLVGWLTDRIGRRRLPMLCCAGVGLGATLLWLYGGLPLAVVQPLLFVAGMASGGMVLLFATAREHNPSWAAGATLGLVNMCVMSTGAVFQPLIGWLLDLGWQGQTLNGARVYPLEAYHTALLVLPACLVLSFTGALMVRETHCRPQKG